MKRSDNPFLRVLRREAERMTSRRLYFGVCIVLPLFCAVFMNTIFGDGMMERIPVGIVDLDETATSRSIARAVAACPRPASRSGSPTPRPPGRPCGASASTPT